MIERLKADMKTAMKEKDKAKLGVIRGLLSAMQYEEMQKKTDLTEKEQMAVLKNEVKKRREAIEFLQKEDRETEITANVGEIAVIESYLPAQLSDEGLRALLVEFSQESENADMGSAMQFLKENHAGEYDGKTASTIARDIFA